MRRDFGFMRVIALGSLLAVMLCGGPIDAQEGHPLVGSWHGDRGTDARNRTDVTVVMDYDGERITGVVNPGFESMELQDARLIPKGWLVHFVVESKDQAGQSQRCVVDGKIDKLGSDQRTIAGTWVCGSVKQDFTLTRARDYSSFR